MKGIIIAAGPATRLRPLTEDTPKCMLKVHGKPIMENTLEILRANGVEDISVIRGYKKEKINFQDVTYFENPDFWSNNILHSLMFAREKLEETVKSGEDVLVTYADIWFNDSVVKALLNVSGDIAIVVDTEWEDNYNGRSDHPTSEAENTIIDREGKVLKIGKDIFTDGVEKNKQGEFIGLWKFSSKGVKIFLQHFDRLNGKLGKTDPYQNAKEWRKSYITDIFQEMIDQGEVIHAAMIQKNWKEFDTIQDFELVKRGDTK